MSQALRTPNIDTQRAAMKKLHFLVGKWAGEARLLCEQGEPLILAQTEEAHYKLDGLILLIEGIGRTRADSRPALQGLGIISYDDETGINHMRAFNDGRFLETDVHLLPDATGLKWGFALGAIRTSSVLRINEKGEWTELGEIAIGAQPPRRFLELSVKRLL